MAKAAPMAKPTPTKKVTRVNLSELYLSLQGEGLWVGIPMVFVRTTGCLRRCLYCDSEYTLIAERLCRIYHGWKKGLPDLVLDNPLALEQVLELTVKAAGDVADWVTFTGGEPLLQADFLAMLGAELKGQGFRILLETEGGLPDRLQKVLPYLDAVAADIKLPSTTGELLDWEKTERFGQLVSQAPVQACFKIVVTPDIEEAEFLQAVELLARLHCRRGIKPRPTCPPALILQPVTPARFVHEAPSLELLLRLASIAQKGLDDVRIVPQVHKLVNLA